VCLLIGLVAACDAGSAFETELPDGTQVDIGSDFALNDGETFAVEVEITDVSGSPVEADLSWSSSDSAIATVNGTGIVTGQRPGTAIISAGTGDVRDSVQVLVRQVPVSLEYVSGSDQEGVEFEPLSQPASVRLLDRHDDPVNGITIDFIAASGGGEARPGTATTDAQGNASTIWTLGASGPQELRSVAHAPQHVSGIPDSMVVFTAMAEEAEPGPDPEPVNPSAVTDLEVTGATETALTLRWTAVTDGDGGSAKYTVRYGSPSIQWSAAHATEIAVPAGQAGTSITYTYSGLAPGTGYQFQLVSYRGTLNAGAVFGPVSNVVAATTDDDETPPPSPLTAGTATATPGDGQVTLSAAAPAGGTQPHSYQWHGGTSDPGATPGAGTALAGLVSLNATHAQATNGTTYHYRLVVTDQDGATAVSNVTSATPEGTGSSAQTLLHEDWSGGIDTDVWEDGYRDEHHAVVNDPTGSGRGSVLRATHTDDGGASHLAYWAYGSGEMNPTGELFIRTWLHVPADFNASDYAKMLIIKGNRMDNLYSSFGQAGNSSNGTNFFESYVSYGAPGHSDAGVHFYTYHVAMPGDYGDIDNTRSADADALAPAPGAWHKFEFWLRQNTSGQSNGEQRIWIDDELALEWTGLSFRTQDILQANCAAVTFSTSNNQGQVWYVDDVYVMDRLPSGMAGW
jgi:hypothetical protein